MTMIDKVGRWSPSADQAVNIDSLMKAGAVVARCLLFAVAGLLLIQPAMHFLFMLLHGKGGF